MVDQQKNIEETVVRTPQGTNATRVEHAVTAVPSQRDQRMASIRRTQQIVYFVATVFAILLGLRILLLALGANEANGFANFIYTFSYPLAAPFLSLFGSDPQYGQSVFEISSLVAIAVYYLVAWGISKIITLTSAPPDPTGRSYE